MAYTRVSMRKTREILRLHHSAALSNRAIARSLKLSASTVSACLARARAAAVRWPLPGTMTDTALEQALYPPPPERSVPRPLPAWATVHRELKRKGVTLMLLWEAYKAAHPNGVMYSAFCDHYRAWCGQLDVVMRQDHRAGDKRFIDSAGQTVPIVNRDIGEINQAGVAPFPWTVWRLGFKQPVDNYFHSLAVIADRGMSDDGVGCTSLR